MNLTKYDAARQAVQECATVDEAKGMADKAEAMRVYAKQAHDTEMEVWVAEIRLRALRRLGEISKTLEKASGSNLSNVQTPGHSGKREVLAEAGIKRSSAHTYEKIADIPEDKFEAFIAEKKAAGQPVTAQDAIAKVSKAIKREEKSDALRFQAEALPDKRYPVIYADPPWKFETHSSNGLDRAADNHYPTMTLADIAELPISSLALPDCVLWLWTTVPMLQRTFSVLDGWGFEYKSQVVWVKDRIGTGYWTRNKHEILLICTRGTPLTPDPANVPDSAISAPVGRHSEKPAVFRQIIERIYPNLPKLEMFARGQSHGWDSWGNEAEDVSDPIERAFENWWLYVPRKAGKGQARKAYKTAHNKAGADTLLACIQGFAEQSKGKEPEFICHPATWLNGERWLDEAPAPCLADQNAAIEGEVDNMLTQAMREADKRDEHPDTGKVHRIGQA